MPVEVILISIDRNDSINFRLENSFNGQEFSLDPGFIVGEILLDPELWLISKTDFIVSVPILHSSGGVTIFPNPTKHILNIYNSWGDIIEEVKVFSVDGIQVRSFKVDLNRIDISSLSNGLYLIQVNTSQGTFEQKIVKQ
jgi:hypothetical protein